MNGSFSIKRSVIALLGSGAILFAVELAKGHQHTQALQFAILWGLVFAAVFTLFGYIRFKRNPFCMIPQNKKQ